jgi:biopolymer transport protein ExbD
VEPAYLFADGDRPLSNSVLELAGRTTLRRGTADVESRVTELVRGQTDPEKRRVMFRCDAKIKHNVFAPVLEAIVAGGGIVTAVGEKPPAK